MIEEIGNVKLNLTYYTGKDQYSDGDIEDELLQIVQAHNDFDEVISKDTRWPILYHLSKYRENIIEWYPFEQGSSVLEIGAGCGAITGALSKKVDHVTCVELSKKRSLINAYRHQEFSNIEILVGNLNEMKFAQKYDYITLIGVLEYAPSFIESNKPFHTFLERIRGLLKPNGKLFIAIENKFGLKYWAGAREDHTGKFFDSLEGYIGNKNVKTFSKHEIEDVLAQCGFSDLVFYYPFPDYKLPFQIFSEYSLPQIGELGQFIHHFDNDRMQVFNEYLVANSIISSHQIEFFANSFLVVCE